MTSGAKTAIREALIWLTAASAICIGIIYFQEISSIVGLGNGPNLVLNSDASNFDEDEDREEGFERTLTLHAKRDGHFYSNVSINGREIPVIVDTGATVISLRYEDAEELGLNLQPADFKYKTRTANGIAKSARLTIERVRLGDITVRDVQASVGEPGRLPITLLGMSFLGQLTSVQLSGNELILTQ